MNQLNALVKKAAQLQKDIQMTQIKGDAAAKAAKLNNDNQMMQANTEMQNANTDLQKKEALSRQHRGEIEKDIAQW